MYKKIVIIVILRYAWVGWLMNSRYGPLKRKTMRRTYRQQSQGQADNIVEFVKYLWRNA